MGKMMTCPQCGRKFEEPVVRCPTDGSALYGPEVMLRIGQRIGSYELKKVVGVGGMGVVYFGHHVMLNKPVAIKILHERFANRDGAVDQFLREAQAATRIRHPNIVDVTDFGIAQDNSVYFVMEYLEGISLEDVLARDRLVPLFNAVNIVRQAARALAAAHDQGIVHRDLKPENIYLINREGRRQVVRRVPEPANQGKKFVVEKEGKFDFVKLLDFGVAKYTLEDVSPSISTRAGMIFGTPHYMSPEQARADKIDGRSDIYALGIVFYEMVTGFVPFDGEAALDILNGHVYGQLIPPKERNPKIQVDEATNQTICKCLAKHPADRFQTMDELVEALAECFTDTVFLRDAHRMPGALESGIVPPKPSAVAAAPAPPPLPTSPSPVKSTEPQPLKSVSAPPAPASAPAAHRPSSERLASITNDLKELFSGAQISAADQSSLKPDQGAASSNSPSTEEDTSGPSTSRRLRMDPNKIEKLLSTPSSQTSAKRGKNPTSPISSKTVKR